MRFEIYQDTYPAAIASLPAREIVALRSPASVGAGVAQQLRRNPGFAIARAEADRGL